MLSFAARLSELMARKLALQTAYSETISDNNSLQTLINLSPDVLCLFSALSERKIVFDQAIMSARDAHIQSIQNAESKILSNKSYIETINNELGELSVLDDLSKIIGLFEQSLALNKKEQENINELRLLLASYPSKIITDIDSALIKINEKMNELNQVNSLLVSAEGCLEVINCTNKNYDADAVNGVILAANAIGSIDLSAELNAIKFVAEMQGRPLNGHEEDFEFVKIIYDLTSSPIKLIDRVGDLQSIKDTCEYFNGKVELDQRELNGLTAEKERLNDDVNLELMHIRD